MSPCPGTEAVQAALIKCNQPRSSSSPTASIPMVTPPDQRPGPLQKLGPVTFPRSPSQVAPSNTCQHLWARQPPSRTGPNPCRHTTVWVAQLPMPTCVGCVRLMTGGCRALVTVAAVFPAVRWTGLLNTTAVSAVVACEAGGCCWLCWMKAAESGVSCLKAGKLLWAQRQMQGQQLGSETTASWARTGEGEGEALKPKACQKPARLGGPELWALGPGSRSVLCPSDPAYTQ